MLANALDVWIRQQAENIPPEEDNFEFVDGDNFAFADSGNFDFAT